MKKILVLFLSVLITSLSIMAFGSSSKSKPAQKLDVYVLTAETQNTAGEIKLSWTSTNPTVNFELQRSYNGIDFFTIGKISSENYFYVDSNLGYQIKYFYRVNAINPMDDSIEQSNIATATTIAALPNPYHLFDDSFNSKIINPAWTFIGGKWIQNNGSLQQVNDKVVGDIKKAVLKDKIYPDDQTITSKLMVTSWKNGDGSHVGVGIYTDPITGHGYQLLFNDNNKVQFLNDAKVWGNAFPFQWKMAKWYWFKLTKQKNVLLGKVWEDGMVEPSNWMFQQAQWTDRTSGYPALSGGGFKSGFSTAMFDSVKVTGTLPTADPFAVGGDASVHPEDFKITTFATGLNYPKSMQALSDGSLIVATSDPIPGPQGNYFASTGKILRFVDLNGDGVADGPGEILYSELPGTLTSLRVAGNLVYVTSSETQKESIWILRMGEKPSDAYTLAGVLHFGFPTPNWSHTTYTLAVRDKPGDYPNEYELFFGVGSQFNAAKNNILEIPISGLMNTTVGASSIYRIQIKDTGSSIVATNKKQIAYNVRNVSGMAFDPDTGDLYFEDNGMDSAIYPSEPLSADGLYKISAARIGVTVLDFGFPNSYISYRTNKKVGSEYEFPLVAFQPWPDFVFGSESEGAVEIAMAPPGFPLELNKGVFTGFFGRFNLAGRANEENPVVFYNSATGKYFHFISNKEPKLGYPIGLLSTNDSLYIADLSSNGDLTTAKGTGAGVIYKIQSLKKPNICQNLAKEWIGSGKTTFKISGSKYQCNFDVNIYVKKDAQAALSVKAYFNNWNSASNTCPESFKYDLNAYCDSNNGFLILDGNRGYLSGNLNANGTEVILVGNLDLPIKNSYFQSTIEGLKIKSIS